MFKFDLQFHSAQSPIGTQFKLGDSSLPETFAAIGGLKSISGIGASRDPIDISTLETNGWDQIMPGIKKSKQITLEVNFDTDDATHDWDTGLISNFNDNVKANAQLVFPNGVIFSFEVYVVDFEINGFEVDGIISGTFIVKPTGIMSFNTGSGS
ncbi:MAG: hypothetical protein GX163_06740 [Bacteroidetes bacterium]|nr:hypothetical protein [Bacteroidota bacterium]